MKVTIGNTDIKVKLVVTPEAVRNGMQKKRFDEDYQGMFFLMPSKQEQSFWMFDCIIPLDIIFIDGDTITTIHSDCPPCENELECESYRGFGDKVLEITGGSSEQLGIKKGDKVSFSLFN